MLNILVPKILIVCTFLYKNRKESFRVQLQYLSGQLWRGGQESAVILISCCASKKASWQEATGKRQVIAKGRRQKGKD
jgi:hypothetical protein